MARRRKVESKPPLKQQPKSLLRKSTRQKAKKQQLEDGEVSVDVASDNANNPENVDDSKSQESPVTDDISTTNIVNNVDEQNHEHASSLSVAALEEFQLSHNENPSNEQVCSEYKVEEMEVETEPTITSPADDSKWVQQSNIEYSAVENQVTSDSVISSFGNFDKSSSSSSSSTTNYEHANHNSYQIVEKGFSGLHVSESASPKDSALTSFEVNHRTDNGAFNDCGSDIDNSQDASIKDAQNAKVSKKVVGSTSAKSNKKDEASESRGKTKSEGQSANVFAENSSQKVDQSVLPSAELEQNKSVVKDDKDSIIDEVMSEKAIVCDKIVQNCTGKDLMDDERLPEKSKLATIKEQSTDNEIIMNKMDLEDTKMWSSSESSSDTLLTKSCATLELSTKAHNGKAETKIENDDHDATKSESAANGTAVRRSSRIKHIGLRKQRSRGRGLVTKPSQELQRAAIQPGGEKLAELCANQTAINMKNSSETLQFEAESSKCMPVTHQQDTSLSSNANAINCDSNANKPVKVKSRWRRSSELEMSNCGSWPALQSNAMVNSSATDILTEDKLGLINNEGLQVASQQSDVTFPCESNASEINTSANLSGYSSSNLSTAVISDIVGAKISLPMVSEVDREMEERLSQFEHLKENLYLTERYTNKETKRMVCDCFLTEEEIQRGELGCGEDCLNRLLMIECGSRCINGNRCTNRRFQNCNYAKCEVFRTEKKGFGLRATTDLEAGDFIMEYVGEVVDSKDFRRRAKEYSKDKNRHYYFMALKSDQIIDATMKGNISRFINHSCDPNAETQKWTVNGELRIGFFSKKCVALGEELTFDYHFQRYGKEAQRCFCEAANCRGWIGDNPEDSGKASAKESSEDDESDSESDLDDEESDEEDEKEKPQKKQVRRAKREDKKIVDHMEDEDLEEQIDRLCASGLKNRAHTLMLSRLMVRCRELQHRRRLLTVIQSGEQPCRRLFLDYHGLRLMWSYMMDVAGNDSDEARQFRLEIVKTLLTLPIPNRTMLIDSKVLSVVEKWSKQAYHSPSGDSPEEELKPTSEEAVETKEAEPKAENETVVVTKKEVEADVSDLAANLLESWSNLKEVFRIPKKERLEQMKEHEREADRGYDEDVEKEAARETPSYERHKRGLDGRRRGLESPADFKDNGKRPVEERSNLVQVPRMSKFERRQLFALKVAKEEEERQRRQQEELWQQHQAQCLALGVDPYATAALDPQSGYPLYFDPQLAQWQAYPGHVQDAALYQQLPPHHHQQHHQHHLHQQQQQQQQQPPPSSFGQPVASAPNGVASEPFETAADSAQQPPPALDLPPKWKWARDKRGRVYYYHTRERLSQWLPPPPDHIGLQPDSGPESSSADDSSDESVSSRDNDEDDEDEPGPEDTENACADVNEPEDDGLDELLSDEQKQQQQVCATSNLDGMDVDPPPPVKQPDNRKRRDGLVQERIISPRREEDRIDHSKFKELKDKLRRQKEKNRLKDHSQSDKVRKHRRSAKSKSHAKQSQAKSFPSITSDMSPTSERKIKDTFRINMAHVMVHFLNPYRKNDCKQGRITNTEDFKYLARKLTHFVLAKELKHCKSVDELECNDNVKHKAKDFVRKYMNKFGPLYQRDKDED